jgi:hypothetical protein
VILKEASMAGTGSESVALWVVAVVMMLAPWLLL